MNKKVYVLHGHWETLDDRGVTVVCVTSKKEKAIDELRKIAETKAKEYCELCEDELEIDDDDTMFEMRDMKDGGFIGFYIADETLQ